MSRLKFTSTPEILAITATGEHAIQVSDDLFRLGCLASVRSVAV